MSDNASYSLGARLTVLVIVGIALMLVMIGGWYSYVVRQELQQHFDSALAAKAKALATLTEFDSGDYEMEFVEATMPEYSDSESPEYFVVRLRSGFELKRSPTLGKNTLTGSAGTLNELVYEDIELPDGRRGRMLRLTFLPQVDPHPRLAGYMSSERESAVVVVAKERQTLDARLHTLYVLLGVGTLAGLLFAAAIARVALRHTLRPLNTIAGHVETIGSADLSGRLPTAEVPSEIMPLVLRLNSFLNVMEQDFERERRFSSAAAHELRTPVAEIKSLSEVAARFLNSESPEVQRFFSDIQTASGRLDKLVAALLALSRAQGKALGCEQETVLLATMIDHVCTSLQRKTVENHVQVHSDVPETVLVNCHSPLLELIVMNLVDNAISYATPGSTVRVSSNTEPDGLSLRVMNQTEKTLDQRDLDKLVLPFWRKDDSRSDSTHLGLGLSLVVAYAEALDLSFSLSVDASGVFCASVGGLVTVGCSSEPVLISS